MIEPANLKLVEDKHLLLNEAIEDLEHRKVLSLSIQKQELSVAHAGEIQTLQDEIESLKLDKIKLEEKIASDERVRYLENERDYYRKESLKLHAAAETMKSKLEKSEIEKKKMKREIEMLKLAN